MNFNINILLTVLISLLFILIPLVIYAIHRLGIGPNEIKLIEDIEKKGTEIDSELKAEVNNKKNTSKGRNYSNSKCIEIEKLLIDTAQLKFQVTHKHNIDRLKLVLTIFTVVTTLIATLTTFNNYVAMSNKDRKANLDEQFVKMAQIVASENENEREIAIIAFPRFALPSISQNEKFPELKKEYESYDDFIFDFMQKYPYVVESTSIIINELEKKAFKNAEKLCKADNIHNNCKTTKDLYDYFRQPFTGTVYLNTIINSLNLITNETLQKNIIIKDEAGKSLVRNRISGIDLRKKYLYGAYFRNVNFQGMNAKNVKFISANLSNANLSYSYLEKAEIVNTNFRFANLSNACLVNSLVNRNDFTGANLAGADFTSTLCTNSIFRNANIANAKFNNAVLYDAKFLGDNLKIVNKPIDELVKLDAITPSDNSNYENARCGINERCTQNSKNLPDFNGAIIDLNNYQNIDFINGNYYYKELNKTDILNSNYEYAIRIYLVNEKTHGKKIGVLKKKLASNVIAAENNKKITLNKWIKLF